MRYCRSSRIEESKAGNRAILYHKDQRKAVVLNPTGSLVWGFLEQPQAAEDLILSLQQSFPQVDPQQLARDMQPYLEELVEQGVIVLHNA